MSTEGPIGATASVRSAMGSRRSPHMAAPGGTDSPQHPPPPSPQSIPSRFQLWGMEAALEARGSFISQKVQLLYSNASEC